jgi:hypothetical protein
MRRYALMTQSYQRNRNVAENSPKPGSSQLKHRVACLLQPMEVPATAWYEPAVNHELQNSSLARQLVFGASIWTISQLYFVPLSYHEGYSLGLLLLIDPTNKCEVILGLVLPSVRLNASWVELASVEFEGCYVSHLTLP